MRKDYITEAQGITRFEVIDHRNIKRMTATEVAHARVFNAWGCKLTISIQDDGQTLKIFVNDGEEDDEEERQGHGYKTGRS